MAIVAKVLCPSSPNARDAPDRATPRRSSTQPILSAPADDHGFDAAIPVAVIATAACPRKCTRPPVPVSARTAPCCNGGLVDLVAFVTAALLRTVGDQRSMTSSPTAVLPLTRRAVAAPRHLS